jgi:hypothetical protein
MKKPNKNISSDDRRRLRELRLELLSEIESENPLLGKVAGATKGVDVLNKGNL